MEASDEVKKLSKRKQRLSLGGSAKRKKLNESNTKGDGSKRPLPPRTSVIRPNGFEWPNYQNEWKEELMTLLAKLLEPMKLPNRKVPLNEIRKADPEKKAEFRRQWMMDEATKVGFQMTTYFLRRSSVALGVNCVSKGLERDKLVGVIIEKNVTPEIITKLLIPIAEGKGVPIVAIDGLNATFKDSCGMRCIAMGLKLPCAEISNHFFPLLEHIQSAEAFLATSPVLDSSNVASGKASKQQTPSSSKSTPKRGGSNQNEGFKKKKIRKMAF